MSTCGRCRGRGFVKPTIGFGDQQCPACKGTGVKVQKSSLGKIQKTCEACGGAFTVYRYRSDTARYCSTVCSGQGLHEQTVRSYPPKDEVARLVQIEGITDRELGAHYGHSYQWALSVRRYYGIDGWPTGTSRNRRLGKPTRRIDSLGYVTVSLVEGGQEREHRLVAEKMLGRPLEPGEVVHHIDGDKTNNSPGNLRVFANSTEHMKVAHPARPRKPVVPGESYDTRKWGCKMKKDWVCRSCGVQAVHLHHAIPRSVCRATKLDLRNGLPLCRSCHVRWHEKTLTIYRDVFTEDEWAYISSVELTGQRIEAWLDDHYPERTNERLAA
jgi:hypothetical protein